MANQYSLLAGDYYVQGTLTANDFDCPPGAIRDAGIASDADIAATKIEHQYCQSFVFPLATTVSATEYPVHCTYGVSSTLIGVDVVPIGSVPSGTYKYFVDVQKGNTSTGFATVLAGWVSVSSVSSVRTPIAGNVSNPSFTDGDIASVKVSVTGASGAQGQGLMVNCWFRETAQ